jgi:hypothetical protein
VVEVDAGLVLAAVMNVVAVRDRPVALFPEQDVDDTWATGSVDG